MQLKQPGLYFNWFQLEEEISFSVGEMTWTAGSFMSTGATTVMLFYGKMLKSAVLHPDELTVLRDRVASGEIRKERAALVLAIFDKKTEELAKVEEIISESKMEKGSSE